MTFCSNWVKPAAVIGWPGGYWICNCRRLKSKGRLAFPFVSIAKNCGKHAGAKAIHVVLGELEAGFLVQVIDWLSVHSRRLNTLYFTQDRPTTNSYQDHLEIIAALRDKDEARARQLARDNILRTIDVVQASSPSPDR